MSFLSLLDLDDSRSREYSSINRWARICISDGMTLSGDCFLVCLFVWLVFLGFLRCLFSGHHRCR